MNGDRNESCESPLEAVLSETPVEEPPADLKQRCLQAVRDADTASAPRRPALWPIVWKGAAGLAAAFAIMVVAIAVMPHGKEMRCSPNMEPMARALETPPSPQQPQPGGTMEEALGVTIAPEPSPPPAAMVDRLRPAGQAGGAYVTARESGDAASGLRRRYAGAGAAPDGAEGVRVAEARPGGATAGAARRVRMEADQEAEEAATDRSSIYAPMTRKVDAWEIDRAARPWRDESGERQKVTRKEMKVAVDDIEDAHERATSVITKAKGYVDTEELQVNERGEGEAVLSARVPVEALDGVVSQLRELGKVLELHGESEDRTTEYYERGQSIRELAEQEMALVTKYEQEENRSRKQRLYAQIQTIRAQIKAQKVPHKELSSETHFALLTLTLTQAVGPRQFLHRLGQSVPTAGAWLAISAIFWVPVLLVVIAIWRRMAGRTANNA